MTLTLQELEAVEPLSPEWHAQRRAGIGASDAAAVVGLDPWRSPFAVWAAKVHGDETPDNAAMEWGRRLESVVAEKFVDETGFTAIPWPCLVHPEIPWMRANCDRILYHDGEAFAPLEIKTSGPYTASDWDGDAPPDHYSIQGQHQLAVTGGDVVHFAVLIGGRDFRRYEVKRDDALIADLIELERKFWDHVVTETPPPVDGTQSTREALTRYYRSAEPLSEVELGLDALELCAEIKRRKAIVKQSKSSLGELENRLRQLIGAHEIARVGENIVATWKTSTATNVDPAQLRDEYPEVAAAVSKTTDVRKLLVK